MKRIDTPTRAVNLHGTGKDGFRDGTTPGTEATDLDETFFNNLQEEIIAPIESSGQTPNGNNFRQLLGAFDELCLSNYTVRVSVAAGPFNTIIAVTDPAFYAASGIKWNALGSNGGSTPCRGFSKDGVEWDDATIGGFLGTSDIFAAIYFPTMTDYIVVGEGGLIARSSGWTIQTPAGGYSGTFMGVAYGASLLVAVGATGEIQTSANGTAWTHRTAAASYAGAFQAVCFGNGLFVAVGASGEIQTSPDGITWTHRSASSGYTGTFRSVQWDPYRALFVACGTAGEIQTSSDAINWDRRNTGGGDKVSVAIIESQMIVAEAKSLFRSFDGGAWRQQRLSISGTLACVGTDGKSLMGVGRDSSNTFGTVYRFLQRTI